MMRLAIFAAEHAAGTVTRAIAGSVALRRLFGFQHQIERDAEAAAILSVAARAWAEFMPCKMQGKPRFRDFEAAELEAADRVPLADRGPAVAAGRRAAAGAGVKQVPDELAPGAGVLTLDRDPESPAPSGHRAIRTRRRQRFDDRFDDL